MQTAVGLSRGSIQASRQSSEAYGRHASVFVCKRARVSELAGVLVRVGAMKNREAV